MRGSGSKVLLDVSVNRQIEVEAQLAFQEFEDKVRTRGGHMDPRLIQKAIVDRLVRFLGPGVRPPRVEVRLVGSQWSIDILPASVTGAIITK